MRLTSQSEITNTWTLLDTGGASVRKMGLGAAGLLWLGIGTAADPAERLLAFDPRNVRRIAEARDALIERDADRVRASGSVEGFWTIDEGARIWVGPRYFDGRSWTHLDRSGSLPGGRIDFEARSMLGPGASIWVPFRFQGDCSLPADCQARGLRSYGPEGPRRPVIEYAPVPEADRYGLHDVHFVGAPADEPLPDRFAWVAARDALYRLPDGERFGYPLLEPSGEPGELRNAGYATFALTSASGRLQVILWIEEQLPEGVEYRAILATWDAERLGWRATQDLAEDGRLAGADPESDRIVSAAWADWGMDGPGLWCVLSDGRLGLFRDGVWIEAWRPEELGAPAGSRAQTVLSTSDGVVVGTDAAALRLAPMPTADPGPVDTLFLPRMDLRR